jgi:hypothetical protein
MASSNEATCSVWIRKASRKCCRSEDTSKRTSPVLLPTVVCVIEGEFPCFILDDFERPDTLPLHTAAARKQAAIVHRADAPARWWPAGSRSHKDIQRCAYRLGRHRLVYMVASIPQIPSIS